MRWNVSGKPDGMDTTSVLILGLELLSSWCLILGVQQLSYVTLSKLLLHSAWLSSPAKQGSECLSWRVWFCSKQNYMKDLVLEQGTQSKVLGFLPSLSSVFAILLPLLTYDCLIFSLIVFQNKTVFTFVPLWGQQWYLNTILGTWSVTFSFFFSFLYGNAHLW